MEGLIPLNGSQIVAETVAADQPRSISMPTIDLVSFSVSPNYYNSTPLSLCKLNVLTHGIKVLKTNTIQCLGLAGSPAN